MISFPKKEDRREYLFISRSDYNEIGIRSFDLKQELSCIGGERGR